MEQFGIISSTELITTSNLFIDFGDNHGFIKQSKNPLWLENPTYKKLKGRIKQPDKNVSLAIYINGLLSNDKGSNANWTIDIDESAGHINFEYTGDEALFDEAFLIEFKLI